MKKEKTTITTTTGKSTETKYRALTSGYSVSDTKKKKYECYSINAKHMFTMWVFSMIERKTHCTHVQYIGSGIPNLSVSKCEREMDNSFKPVYFVIIASVLS